ncbi:MAG: hypothetical protein L0287_13520 [Anaerolineae bacterium]|nr:hypothetical protein [Anaerolineae bacterium]
MGRRAALPTAQGKTGQLDLLNQLPEDIVVAAVVAHEIKAGPENDAPD